MLLQGGSKIENDVDVTVFVLYDGTWKQDGNSYIFEGAKCTILNVSEKITYTDLLRQLYIELLVEVSLFDLKLQVPYPCGGHPLPPVTIANDKGVSVFVKETAKSVKHRTPICVTIVPKEIPSSNEFVRSPSQTFVPPNHESRFGYHLYQSCGGISQSQPFVDERLIFDLNTSPEVNDYDYCHFSNENKMLHTLPLQNIDEEEDGEKSPHKTRILQSNPPNSRKSIGRKSGNCDNMFKLPSFTLNDVLDSGPVDTETFVTPEELFVGQFFDNKKALQKVAYIYAMKNNFEFVVGKSGKDVWYIVCKDVKNYRWRLRGKQLIDSDIFKVVKFYNVHTCDLDVRHQDHRQATPWIVGHLIKNKFGEEGSKCSPKDIILDMKNNYGIEIKYEKAWRCREKVLEYVRGTPEVSYAMISSYLHMLQMKNPGTIHDLVTEEDGAFKYCFYSLGACRRGFRACRPVICVDGTFMKSRYGGVLLCAVALDADNHLYPIAVGIVDSENHDFWIYFMNQLRISIGHVDDLVFISDRHKSIAHALEVVFPNAHHGACYYHIKQNVIDKFKTNVCEADMCAAAYAFRRTVFDRHFRNIQARDP